MPQLVPDALDTLQFLTDRNRLYAALGEQTPDVRWYTAAFNPYPWLLTPDEAGQLTTLAETLQRAVTALVPAWFADARIRRLVGLSEPVESLLRRSATRPYRAGAIRPDFLYDESGVPRVSEINARFPLNGFLVSHSLERTAHHLGAPAGVLSLLPHLLDGALHGARIGIVQGIEAGWDIRILQTALGPQARRILPQALTVVGTGLGDDRGPVDILVLELHQHEILALPSPVLQRLAKSDTVLNDLRTIFLAHDKRLLAVMSTSIMRDYVSHEDVQRLQRHVIPTFPWSVASEAIEHLRTWRSRWLIKPATAGKGEGLVMGRHCAPEEWSLALRRIRPDSVVQPYIQQRLFPVATLVDGEHRTVPIRVVGTLPIFHGTILGPGIFRASQADIVNVVGGGTVMTAIVPSCDTASRDTTHARGVPC